MREKVFTTNAPWLPDHADRAIIHCSDFRYHAHFEEFITQHLGIEEIDSIVVPGGPHGLFQVPTKPKWAWANNHSTQFLVEGHGLSELVLVSHEGCSWFRAFLAKSNIESSLADQQEANLLKVMAQLRKSMPNLSITGYFCGPNTGGHVDFHLVI